MKKSSMLFSFLLMGAMLLAACSGGGSTSGTPGAGTLPATLPSTGLTTTPATGTTGTPALGTTGTPAPGLGTPTTGAGMETASPAAGLETTTPAAGMTGTPSGALTTTPGASTGNIPNTGMGAQFVPLTALLNMGVQGQDGTQFGTVQGVIIDRPGETTSNSSGTGTLTETPAAGSTMSLTETPVVGSTMSLTETPTLSASGSGAGTTTSQNAPRVSFLVVNQAGAGSSSSGSSSAMATQTPTAGSSGSSAGAMGNAVLVPWQAFTMTGAGSTSGGSSSGVTTQTPAAGMATETPATGSPTGAATATPLFGGSNEPAGATPTVGSSSGGAAGVTSGSGTLTLTISPSVLSGAPAFDPSAFSGAIPSEVSQYWAGQNLGVPVTGANASATPVLITNPMSSMTLNDQSGSSFGQVSDLLVDAQTGYISYAVLSGASSFSGKMYVVPASVLSWQGGQAKSNSLGQAQLKAPSTAFDQAPSIHSMSELDLSSPTWHTPIDSYWATQAR